MRIGSYFKILISLSVIVIMLFVQGGCSCDGCCDDGNSNTQPYSGYTYTGSGGSGGGGTTTITPAPPPPNPPIITPLIQDQTVDEDSPPWNLNLSRNGKPGNASLSGWTPTGGDATKLGVRVNENNIATFTLVPNAYGTVPVTFVLSDEKGLRASQSINVNINRVNDYPEIISVPPMGARVGTAYSYTVVATDPDGDDLTYLLIQGPSGMAFYENILTWTPSSAGAEHVRIKVMDANLTKLQSFTLTIT